MRSVALCAAALQWLPYGTRVSDRLLGAALPGR